MCIDNLATDTRADTQLVHEVLQYLESLDVVKIDLLNHSVRLVRLMTRSCSPPNSQRPRSDPHSALLRGVDRSVRLVSTAALAAPSLASHARRVPMVCQVPAEDSARLWAKLSMTKHRAIELQEEACAS